MKRAQTDIVFTLFLNLQIFADHLHDVRALANGIDFLLRYSQNSLSPVSEADAR